MTANWTPRVQIKARSLMPEQERLIVDLYILKERPAREVAEALGSPAWGPHDIYVYARKLQKKLGIPYYNRGPESRIDWSLVQALRDEGMSDQDISAYYQSSQWYIRARRKHKASNHDR